MGKYKLRHGSIQVRVLALTLLFTLGVSLVIAIGNMRQMAAEWERTTLLNAEYALQTAAAAIHRDIEEVDDLASWCAYNPSMRTYLLTDVSSNNQALSMYPTISAKYSTLRTMQYVQRFVLINAKGRQMVFGTAVTNTVAMTPKVLARIPGYDEEYSGWSCIMRDPMALTSQALDTIPLTRKLTLSGTGREAHICAFVSPALITAALKGFTMPEGSSLLWQMGGRYYGINGNILTEEPLSDIPAEQLDVDMLDDSTEVYSIAAGYDAQLMVRYPIGVHDLYLIEIIPNGPLQRQIPYLSDSLVISLLAILVLGLLLAFLLHRMITPPITALQNRITKISSGDFSFDPAIEWNNELGDIGRGINSMSASVTALMDHRLEDEKQKQDLEYRMLQNQINPHFIYNTLNSIKWMATIQHAPGIAEMVTALSRLLKSVSKSNERLVPLYEEFALLNDYFTIQQYRYGGTITLDVSYIEDEKLNHSCLIPRFTLQPLVENAIFHGIEPKGSAGEVTLRVERDTANGDVLIRLTDDGIGMTAEQAAKALQEPGPEEAAAKYRHVGMWNVHKRLQYSFGEAYGLSIESEPGVGTTVMVRLPGPPAQQ
ncbi:sensor histidine kinase [uncultured Gemmiger sp.]|uniref:sensor histidine kinase n=1 Tax=uncultured Gemmiger sp. TaxID=1623490 RepID=UPI0025D7B8A4|nr:histidine kinase [uncultured Gemmiger sp.]